LDKTGTITRRVRKPVVNKWIWLGQWLNKAVYSPFTFYPWGRKQSEHPLAEAGVTLAQNVGQFGGYRLLI